MNSLLRSFCGKIIPRDLIPTLISQTKAGAPEIQARLKIGEHVRVRIDDLVNNKVDWLIAIVMDIHASYGMGIFYVLAFPVLGGDTWGGNNYYVLSQDYQAIRFPKLTNGTESAESSGIYTEQEFGAYLASLVPDEKPKILTIVK